MPSCDTLVALGKKTATGQNLFGKNSDRDVTESQPLVQFPAQKYPPGEKLKCTYITIDQAEETYQMIGSKPWWIWGFEHGINEFGVAIGNEAVWSNIPVPQENLLLGMDLLRLGLERGKTAYEAMHVITDMMQKYGQGGACMHGHSIDDFSYHNSYLIMDPKEAWLLETVGKHWAAKKITDTWCISNVYSIEEDYDECSDGLIEFAIENELHRPGQPFNFAMSFLLMSGSAMSGHPRECRMNELLEKIGGNYTVEDFMAILRDHYEDNSLKSRWSPASSTNISVCMHGIDPLACQTAATMIIDYHDTPHKDLLFTYWGAMAPPCSSFFVPFYNTGYVPEKLAGGTNKFSEDSFWWMMNRLASDIESDYEKYIHYVHDRQGDLEGKFRKKAAETEKEAARLLDAGDADAAVKLLNALTDECLAEVEAIAKDVIPKIEADIAANGVQPYRAPYLKRYKAQTNLP